MRPGLAHQAVSAQADAQPERRRGRRSIAPTALSQSGFPASSPYGESNLGAARRLSTTTFAQELADEPPPARTLELSFSVDSFRTVRTGFRVQQAPWTFVALGVGGKSTGWIVVLCNLAFQIVGLPHIGISRGIDRHVGVMGHVEAAIGRGFPARIRTWNSRTKTCGVASYTTGKLPLQIIAALAPREAASDANWTGTRHADIPEGPFPTGLHVRGT